MLLRLSVQAHAQDNDLYRTIVSMDSIFFAAYNNCDMAKQAEIYADSLEFYHDKTGLSTSRQDILANTKKYICGKVNRQLVAGSIEVSPLPGYGAVELGSHMFVNKAEMDDRPHASRLVIIWKNDKGAWRITRVISLH
jgi:hypothetical protein